MGSFLRVLRPLYRVVMTRRHGRRVRRWTAAGLVLGEGVSINQGVALDSWTWLISIGDGATLAPGVRIVAHDASTHAHLGVARVGRVDIGCRVFVGADSTVLPGVRIGDDAVVAAGSVVVDDVAPRTVVGGVPARELMTLEAFLDRQRAAFDEASVRFSQSDRPKGRPSLDRRRQMRESLAEVRTGWV